MAIAQPEPIDVLTNSFSIDRGRYVRAVWLRGTARIEA